MTDKVQLIKVEVKKRIELLQNGDAAPEVMKRVEGVLLAYNSILQLMDSLPEEPASEDLEEACDNYYDETWDEHGGIATVVNNCHDIWFPSQATSDFFKAGAEWQKQHMMKDAVEAEVMYPASSSTLQIRYKLPKNTKLKYGDKVKIIVVMEN